jgi:carbon storage regulator CsrA
MLVLSRKTSEAVVVGGPNYDCMLKVTVLEVKGGRVRLGFQADAAVLVHRLEVWERISHNGRQSGQLNDSEPTA